MSFWTGFTTELAKSVDQGLQKAMSKRDDELSRAKTFWQTRQAQKLDQKEAYDARSEKALRRMIQEAGDDTSLGLAAFNAAGGDADSVESLIKRIDDTRANKGKYNLLDSLRDADGKPLAPASTAVELDDALKSVRMQMKGIDASNIKIDDPLAKFGLGLRGGAAQKAADSVNQMIQPEIISKLTGIPKASLDMSNMIRRADGSFSTSVGDPDEWVNALNAASSQINSEFVNTVRRPDGTYGPAASTLINNTKALKDISDSLSGETTDAPAAATKSDNTKNKPLFDTLDSIGKNKSGFAADIFSKLPDVKE